MASPKKNPDWPSCSPEKQAEYQKRYREKHAKAIKARAKERYQDPIIRARMKESRRQYRERNREKRRLQQKLWDFKLTLEEYEAFAQRANGKCEICGKPEKESRGSTLVIDHNHITGEVRGLLCSTCNQGLGFLNDSPSTLKSALAYLRKRGAERN